MDLALLVKAIVGNVLRKPDDEPVPLPVVELARPRALPCDLFLTTGPESIRLFPRGPFDEFRFYQRPVSSLHEVEFVTRLDAEDAGTENFKAFGVFNLKGRAHALPDLDRLVELRRSLARR